MIKHIRYMKKVIQAIVIVALILAAGMILYFVAQTHSARMQAALPVAERIVEIRQPALPESENLSAESPEKRARIQPDAGQIVLDALDMNLDADEELEQLLIVRPAHAANGRISVMIADFAPLTGNYARLWSGETLATKPGSFVVQPRDLLQDGRVEILCYGIDDERNQTLDIFRQVPGVPGSYVSVFSEAGSSLSIGEGDNGSPAGQVPAISVYRALKGGKSPLDSRMTVYAWNAPKQLFIVSREEFVPGANMEKIVLDRILTGKAGDFESYIEGLWYRKSGEDTVFVDFCPSDRKIRLRSGSIGQEWEWNDSTTGYAGLFASVSNDAIPELARLVSVSLVGPDAIRIQASAQRTVRFAAKEDWDGVYRRYSPEAVEAKVGQGGSALPGTVNVACVGSDSRLALLPSDFIGTYVSEGGDTIELDGRGFAISPSKGGAKGYYGIYGMGDDAILDLQTIDERNLPAERLCFIISARAGKMSPVGTIVLSPARILDGRAEPLYKPDLSFSRLED